MRGPSDRSIDRLVDRHRWIVQADRTGLIGRLRARLIEVV